MAAVLAAALVVAGCAGSSGGAGDAAAPSKSHSPTAPADPAYVTARVRLGTKPCGIQVAGSTVWVSNYGDATLQTVDAVTGDPAPPLAKPVRVGAEPCGVAVGGGSVWVEGYGSNEVTRVDQTTGKVLATVEVGQSPYDVTYANGAAWVTDYLDGTVSRVDAATNRRTAIRVGGQPAGIAPVAGGLWVALADTGQVVRIDARTGRVTDRLRTGQAGAVWTAYDENMLWVTGPGPAPGTAGGPSTVVRIDPVRRKVVARVTVGSQPADGVVVDGQVYIPDSGGSIYRIDPAGNTVTATFTSGTRNPFVVTGADGALWAADYQGTDAVRIDLARVGAKAGS